mgnify:CR=1 FL=1
MKRIGIPEDIAAACAYLVSDEAGYVTGQIIGVNGGRVTVDLDDKDAVFLEFPESDALPPPAPAETVEIE